MAAEVSTKVRQISSNFYEGLRQQTGSTTTQQPASQMEERQVLPREGQILPAEMQESADNNTHKLDEIADEFNNYVQNVRRELQFSVDDDSGRVIITVIDSESQEVIRQIPPEDISNIRTQLRNAESAGILVNAKV